MKTQTATQKSQAPNLGSIPNARVYGVVVAQEPKQIVSCKSRG